MSKRKERLYDLRWQATNHLVLYELGAHIKIRDFERHWKIRLFMLVNDPLLIHNVRVKSSSKVPETCSYVLQPRTMTDHVLLVLLYSCLRSSTSEMRLGV